MIDNSLSIWLYALNKDTPAKTWWNATAMHPGIFRALHIAKDEPGAIFAAMPFRLARIDETPVILSAHPCPPFFDERGDDWLGIEHVIAWNPVTDTAHVLGDPGPQIIGRAPASGEVTVFASPYAFFRAYAEARAQWLTGWQAIESDWHRRPEEPDLTPGFLLIGNADKVRWPISELPEHFTTQGIDPQTANRAMLRQVRIPRASAKQTNLRKAA